MVIDARHGAEPEKEPAITRAFSLEERRRRTREEMTAAILGTARELMREEGTVALNLNEIARRIGITTPAIYGYFPSKEALYDALLRECIRLFKEGEDEIWGTTKPDWERVRAWFEVRLRLAEEHSDLYRLGFGSPVPGLVPSEESRQESRELLAATTRGLTEVIQAGVIDAGMPPDRVIDILLAVRHGIVSEHLSKQNFLPPGSDRFSGLIPDVIEAFRTAWSSRGRNPQIR